MMPYQQMTLVNLFTETQGNFESDIRCLTYVYKYISLKNLKNPLIAGFLIEEGNLSSHILFPPSAIYTYSLR